MMKTHVKTIRNRIKKFFQRRGKPVIRIERSNPWKGEKLVRVLRDVSVYKIFGLFVLALALAACSGQGADVVPNTGGEGSDLVVTTDDIALQAIDAAVNQLSQSAGANVEDIRVLSAERVEWGNACLDLAAAGETCAQVVTPGFRVLLEANGQQYEFHTDESGVQVRQAPS
jgi:hypothetical protein